MMDKQKTAQRVSELKQLIDRTEELADDLQFTSCIFYYPVEVAEALKNSVMKLNFVAMELKSCVIFTENYNNE